MEVVENALTSSGSSARVELELARDSSAVVSVVSWEQRQLGALLTAEPLFRALQGLVVTLILLEPAHELAHAGLNFSFIALRTLARCMD